MTELDVELAHVIVCQGTYLHNAVHNAVLAVGRSRLSLAQPHSVAPEAQQIFVHLDGCSG